MISTLLHTAATYGTVLALTPSLGPMASFVSRKDELESDRYIRLWARALFGAARVTVDVKGLERCPARPCVYVSNHQSHFDPPLLFLCLPGHVRFVAKAELFKIPFFGSALKNTGFIKVDRSGGQHDRDALAGAVNAVRDRTSVLFFPEGTRSDDGVLLPFKKGAAVLALQAQVPLVPVAVAGTRFVLPKNSGLIRGGRRVVVRVGDPIPTEGLGEEARTELTERCRQAIEALQRDAEAALAAG